MSKLADLREALKTGVYIDLKAAVSTLSEAEATIARLQDEVERLSLDLAFMQNNNISKYVQKELASG